jgi:hypothetical protein
LKERFIRKVMFAAFILGIPMAIAVLIVVFVSDKIVRYCFKARISLIDFAKKFDQSFYLTRGQMRLFYWPLNIYPIVAAFLLDFRGVPVQENHEFLFVTLLAISWSMVLTAWISWFKLRASIWQFPFIIVLWWSVLKISVGCYIKLVVNFITTFGDSKNYEGDNRFIRINPM